VRADPKPAGVKEPLINSKIRHTREGGYPEKSTIWIPAFAGMTKKSEGLLLLKRAQAVYEAHDMESTAGFGLRKASHFDTLRK
jgi:hypothetical protein